VICIDKYFWLITIQKLQYFRSDSFAVTCFEAAVDEFHLFCILSSHRTLRMQTTFFRQTKTSCASASDTFVVRTDNVLSPLIFWTRLRTSYLLSVCCLSERPSPLVYKIPPGVSRGYLPWVYATIVWFFESHSGPRRGITCF